MKNFIPPCPKCKNTNTTDIIPIKPNKFDIDFPPDFFDTQGTTIGNCKYYCHDCNYTWKKYRGKKPYNTIKKLEVSTGGFGGPNFRVIVDFHNNYIERSEGFDEIFPIYPINSQDPNDLKEYIAEFLIKLYEVDLMNWASQYNNFSILDGTFWRVNITFDTYCEEKSGTNHFPPKWIKFCKAISRVSGGEFY